ncbi:MAG: transcriptional regulator [Planctomycetes bacterium]|nr:transcriptional regulator [Planctomycetota bacterium]MBL7042918.1 transcriptional regulator [Pirellulaceae bacterium]
MALTRDFRETVKDRADRDPEFRNGLLAEALEAVVRGELDVAKILLRDYINATVGFEAVGKALEKSPKSLMRMLGQAGNPNAKNLFGVTQYLQEDAGVRFKVVTVQPTKAKRRELVP